MGTGILQLAHWAVYVLFAPWTLLLLPVTARRKKEAERQRKRYYDSTHLGVKNPL